MTLFKLSLRNIKKSTKDYAIYFFTVIIGVSIFYMFNAISDQTAMMEISLNRDAIIQLLSNTLSVVSVFVSIVLGLLIIYASRFLIKRRNNEFALYMLLGMSKRKISAILFFEVLFIGVLSLVIGLLFGIGLSQLMSALVANLFEADMTAYKFIVSKEAIINTLVTFTIMYIVVMLFHGIVITRMKLIDLIHAGKKAEKIKLKNPILCIALFVVSVVVLGYAYYQVAYNPISLQEADSIIKYIIMGAVSTFIIFYSVSGMFLHFIMSSKKIYYKNLNCFTFRQISSKVNTMVFSMTIICLMLFVTICALASSFSVRNSLNALLKESCPADYEIAYSEYLDESHTQATYGDVIERFEQYGYNITEYFSDYVHFHSYIDSNFTLATFLGDKLEETQETFKFLSYNNPFKLFRLSDYNVLMELYGKETVELKADEYILFCNFKSMRDIFDNVLEIGYGINIKGVTLKSKYDQSQDGFVQLATSSTNSGIFVIPDQIAENADARNDYLIGNYVYKTKEEYVEVENSIRNDCLELTERYSESQKLDDTLNYFTILQNTRADITESSIGMGAIVAFLGLYIGLVFLIVCGAVLSLKDLSESVDSIGRYEILRNIGVEEKNIVKSLFRQSLIFFSLPLILAFIHSFFGLKFAMFILELVGTTGVFSSIISSILITLVIFGEYFLISFLTSKSIIKERALS